MSADTSSVFAQVIQDHLELKHRNARLEGAMPLRRYTAEDPFDNHPLFKSEEQARLEETMDGNVSFPAVEALDPVASAGEREIEAHLWSRSRDFDWGD